MRHLCGKWLWWMPVCHHHKYDYEENTGISMMCFEAKRDVTPCVSAYLYFHFWQLLNHTPLYFKCVWIYVVVFISVDSGLSLLSFIVSLICMEFHLFTPNNLDKAIFHKHIFQCFMLQFIRFKRTTYVQSKIGFKDTNASNFYSRSSSSKQVFNLCKQRDTDVIF